MIFLFYHTFIFFFFFSSRRRHTRFKCDWSSDVCSSDLSVRPRLCRTEHSLERDRRTPVRSRRHHCFDHRVWDHAKKRALEGCTIEASAYLPPRMGLLILSQRSLRLSSLPL